MRRLLALCAVAGVLATPALAGAGTTGGGSLPFRVPPGYEVIGYRRIADGVEHVRLRSAHPRHVVEVGVVRKGATHRADVRHAGPRSHGPDRRLQGTSEMCDRCAYATNGDYAHRQPSCVVGRPIGGVVEEGIVLVSPSRVQQQATFTFDGGFTTERLAWAARVTSGNDVLRVSGKNVPRGRGRLVLYTPDYVASTGTNSYGAELTLRLPDRADNVVPNVPSAAALVSFRYSRGDTKVEPGTVVLSGHGAKAEALRRLWESAGRDAVVSLAETLSPGNVWASVGGGHILMRDGRRWFARENAPHLTAAHPRTFAGVTKQGHLFHVTVDGRARNAGRSVGMPLEEALRFFTAFGAREVINMDGGGSTTFVRGGRVVNRPSDGAERPVTTAIVVVPGRIPRRAVVPVTPRQPRPHPELPEFDLAVPAPPRPIKPVAAAAAFGNIVVLGGVTFVLRRRRPAVPPA